MTEVKKFFGEFKKFITRGNVIDMAVGVIVGGAFTAIVNAMGNNILKPVINWFLALVLGKDSLSDLYTYLVGPVYVDGVIDLESSIYIDWGAFINAVINFFITALVLFVIVKFINHYKEKSGEIRSEIKKKKLTKEQVKELKARGIKLYDKDAVEAYLAEKQKLADEEAARAKAEQEAKEAAERAANPTAEDLLKEILELMKREA